MGFRSAALLVVMLAGLHTAGKAGAGELEATLRVGQAVPFYEQGFSYDPGGLAPPFPGITVEQRGIFRLEATGGLALGGGVAYFFAEHAGLELRLDTADVRVRADGARYSVRADLPAPFPDLNTEVVLGEGSVDLERLRPVSLNLVLRSAGDRRRVFASAGGSYLPRFRFEVRQPVGLALPALLGGGRNLFDLAQVGLGAEALPSEAGEGRFGFDAGGGVQVGVGRHALVTVEGRYFHFQRQTLTWGLATSGSPVPGLEAAIVREIGARVEPVKFSPRFFQATAGVSFRF